MMRNNFLALVILAGLLCIHTAGDVFAMSANQEIFVGSMHIDILVDDAEHSGDVSLLNNATSEQLAQSVPSKKLSLPYTSLLIRDKGRILLIDSGMGNKLLENLQQKGDHPGRN